MGVLGCGTHTVRIIDRITGRPVASPPLGKVQWGRRRDQWSTASVQFVKRPGTDCCGEISVVRTWRHELEVSRDGVVVWVGPIQRISENRTRIQIDAADRLVWLSRRVLRGTRTMTDIDPTRIFAAVLAEALGRYDTIPVRPALVDCGTTASLSWDFANRTTAWDALRDILGVHVDATMVADILYAGPTTVPAGVVATLSEPDIVGDVDVIEDGDTVATVAHVRAAGGLAATFPPEPSTAPLGDDWWGVIDGIVDRSTAATAAEALAGARSAWRTRRHPPLFVSLPSAARLAPTAPVTVAQLIPGAQVTLSFTAGRCRPVTGRYEIVDMAVSQGSGSGAARTADGQFATAGDAAAENVVVSLASVGASDG